MKSLLLLCQAGACALALAACATSPNSQFYVLSTAPAAGPARTAAAAQLQSVRLSAMTDRPQLVVRTGAQTVEVREYDRWAEPLDEMTTRVLRQDLEARGGMSTTPARVVIVIDEFLPDDDGSVKLSGHWSIPATAPAGTRPAPHPFALAGRYPAGNLKEAAAVMSALLGRLADAIQAELPPATP